ncbi:MAG: hypothetical protein J6A61_05840 [Clostridia bacterium]|nr:hypothetical protein [Clostridia bacterium]
MNDLLIPLLVLLHAVSSDNASIWSVLFYALVLVWLIVRIIQTIKQKG